jgi:hypothetical protein
VLLADFIALMTGEDAHAANKSTMEFHKGVGEMVRENASFSLYMAHGGTNFGFWSGANGANRHSLC